jgi:hypothetical protein
MQQSPPLLTQESPQFSSKNPRHSHHKITAILITKIHAIDNTGLTTILITKIPAIDDTGITTILITKIHAIDDTGITICLTDRCHRLDPCSYKKFLMFEFEYLAIENLGYVSRIPNFSVIFDRKLIQKKINPRNLLVFVYNPLGPVEPCFEDIYEGFLSNSVDNVGDRAS